jgi:hypothetical protein
MEIILSVCSSSAKCLGDVEDAIGDAASVLLLPQAMLDCERICLIRVIADFRMLGHLLRF